MFKKLFKKSSKTTLTAPVNGEIMPLEQVPDPVFSQKIMGDGIAFRPTAGNVVAPIDGEIVLVADTKHAIGIRTTDGIEILIHIGLDTVQLKGEGFTVHVEQGEQVQAGQTLLTCDLDYLRNHAKGIVTPMVISNGHEISATYSKTTETTAIAGETIVLTITKN